LVGTLDRAEIEPPNFLNNWSYSAPPKTIGTNYNLRSRTRNAFWYFVYL